MAGHFPLAAKQGKVPIEEMWRTFNMGVGMVLCLDKKKYENAGIVSRFRRNRLDPWRNSILIRGTTACNHNAMNREPLPIVVLISGNGTNLQAIIGAIQKV